MKQWLMVFVVLFCVVFGCFSQEEHPYIMERNKIIEAYIDSLEKFDKQDTLRVLALQEIYNRAQFKSQTEKVLPYANEAYKLSKKIGYKTGLCYYYVWKGQNLIREEKHKEAFQYIDSVYTIQPPYPKFYYYYCGFAEMKKGTFYKNQKNYFTALEHLFLSVEHYKKSDRLTHEPQDHLLQSYNEIAEIYYEIESLDNAETYLNLIINEVDSEKNKFNAESQTQILFRKIKAELLLSDIYIKQKKYDAAISILKQYKKIKQYGYYDFDEYNYNQKVGEILFIKKQYDSAHYYFKNAYKFASNYQHNQYLANSLYAITQSSLKLGKYEEAKTYAEENIALAQKTKDLAIRINALTGSSNYLNAVGNTKEAYKNLSEAVILKDSLISETNLKQINTLNAIYQSEQNKNAISKLNIANQKKATLNTILVGSSLALLLIGFLGFRNFKHKRNLQNHKISELEKDKQLLTIDAMLKGQEEERSRIAKDLHDGLGGLLSGTKLSFTNMKENLILSPENAAQFENSLGMLDNTISDLRKVAQNLMPEALVKFGLNEALRDFCNTIQTSSGIMVDYQIVGLERKLNNTADVFIYRIVQELVNNAVKHAQASQIMVQLSQSNNKTSITVEDNGVGYTINNISNKKGNGLNNIEYRVNYLNGIIDTQTSLNNGTSVNIELNV